MKCEVHVVKMQKFDVPRHLECVKFWCGHRIAMTSCIGEELEKFFPELAVEAAVPRIWILSSRASYVYPRWTCNYRCTRLGKNVSHELNETDVTCHNIFNAIQLEQQPLQETATRSRHCPTRNKEPHNTKKAESNTTQRKTHHNTADKFSSPPNLNLVATSQCCHQSSNRRGWHFHLQHLFPASAPV
jgi:hypothetical protein